MLPEPSAGATDRARGGVAPPVDSHGHPPGRVGGGAAAAPAPGLVRLVTSGDQPQTVRPEREWQRVRDGRRRALRLFKSLSCSGDFLKEHKDARGRILRRHFVTLTYRPDVDWQPHHVSGYLRRLRDWCRHRRVRPRYVWVAEQHQSGRIHFHAMVFLPKHLALPKPDKSGMWPHGMSQRQIARKGVGYLMKYASKCRHASAPWPKGLRLHGNGGLEAAERIRRTWWVLPRYARELAPPEFGVRRAPGGGWFSPVSGDWWPAWVGWFLPSPGGGSEVYQ